MEDLVIGKDVVLQEYEALHDLLQVLPHKAQVGPMTLVGQVRGIKEHGVKHLFSTLKENLAHENMDIEYTCLDVSHHVVALGSNLGMVFFYDRENKHLTRFSSHSVHDPVTCIKLLSLQSFLASGHSNGSILIFSFMLSSKTLPKSEWYPVTGVHTSAITGIEWSPDGTLLYSGDEEGNISVTVVKVPGKLTQSALLFTENSPIVQLSYSQKSLLVSTSKRTVLWNFATEQPMQVGQKERKSHGKYGACFYPPARVLLEDESEPPLTIYAARPGLRLWTADQNCKVLATLMYKGLMNENPPGVRTLTPLPSPSLAAATRADQSILATPQFGRLQNFHGQFVITWDLHRLWVLDTSPCALVCYHHSYHGDIADVCTVGHEVYILQHKGARLLKKFSLIPRLPNPLLKVRKLLLSTEKLELETSVAPTEKKPTSNRNEKVAKKVKESLPIRDVTRSNEEREVPSSKEASLAINDVTRDVTRPKEDSLPIRDVTRSKEASLAINDVTSSKEERDVTKSKEDIIGDIKDVTSSSDDVINDKTQDLAVLACKLQDVVNEDYGDIVFKPKRSTSKRRSKNTEYEDSNQDVESTNEETSDISSELDYLDRSLSNTNSTDEDSPTVPRVTLVNVDTKDVKLLKSNATIPDNLGVSCEKMEQSMSFISLRKKGTLTPDKKLSQSDDFMLPCDRQLSQSDDSTVASDILSAQSDESIISRVHKLSQSDDSILGERDCIPENPENRLDDSHSFPQIYSTTSLNISDLSFSDTSYDRSVPRQGRSRRFPQESVESSIDVIDDPLSSREGSREDLSNETPPVCLDSDGAEELGDTSSWATSSHTLSEFDCGSMDFFLSIERTYTSQMSQASKASETSAKQMHLLVDSWSDVRSPSPGYVISLDVSDLHIWCVTSHESIFYCPTHFEAITWTQLSGQANMISVNNSGDVIWCVDGKNNAFARKGIREGNLIGHKWLIVEKNIRYVAVDDTAVWGIMQNGDVFMRIEVSKEKPEGKTGKTIAVNTDFVQASCLDGLVWFVDTKNMIHVYKEVTRESPSKKENWHTIRDISTRWACLKIYGWSWIVDTKGFLWFTDKVTHESPSGSEWYQVSLGQYLMQDKTLLDTLWSWVRRGDETKLLTASPKAGLWILGRNGSLNSSRGHLLGGHWQSITPMGVAKSVFWSYVSARGYYAMEAKGNLWALQPSGELICFQPGSRTLAIESPRTIIKLVTASCRTVWGITHNFKVVQRLGVMEDLCPQGIEWKNVELSSFSVGRVCHISSGTLCTWAVDESGGIWLRIGDVEKTDNLVSQVWIAIEGEPLSGNRFVKVAVSPDDAIVWALDDRFNVYARRDVTPNFQVGTSWEVVPGTIVKDVCISAGHVVWAVCANGDVACRYGVSESYPLGDYWKKVPGNFEHISVTPDGELWAINLNGQLFRRKTKHFYGTQFPFKERKYSYLFGGGEEWEII